MEHVKCYQLWAWMSYLGDAVENHLDRLMSEKRLTLTQARVLRLLAVRPGTSPSDVSRLLNRDESTTTGILKRLEARELVRRDVDTTDRRQAHISLTDEGFEMFRYYQREVLKLPFMKSLAEISESDIEVAVSVFERVAEGLGMKEFVELVDEYSQRLVVELSLSQSQSEIDG